MAGEKPVVVVVGPFSGEAVGGVATFQRNLVERSTLKDRWRFVRFSTSRPAKDATVADNYSYGAILNSGLRRAVRGAGITAWHLLSFTAVLRRHRAAVVQIQSSDFYNFWEGMLYIAQAHAVGVPAVIRFGGDFEHFYRISSPRAQRLIRRLLQTPDAIVVQSDGWRRYFSQHTAVERLHVVGNAVLPPPPPPDRAARTGLPQLLFICTADANRKGVDAVLELAPHLRGRARLRFVAAGQPVREQVQALGLEDVVEVGGSLSAAEMAEAYRQADLFLLPSFSEGFPNAMLEAMAAGLPYIGSPVGAVPEVITDGVEGLLVPAGDAPALIQATLSLLDDPARRHRMGAASYRKVTEEYELDVMFARFDRIWGEVIRRRAAPSAAA